MNWMICFEQLTRGCRTGASDARGCWSTRSRGASNGIGRALTGRSPRPRWAGEKTGPNPTDRAKSGTKRSLLTDGAGVPLSVVVSGANVHDKRLVAATLDRMVIDRPALTPRH